MCDISIDTFEEYKEINNEILNADNEVDKYILSLLFSSEECVHNNINDFETFQLSSDLNKLFLFYKLNYMLFGKDMNLLDYDKKRDFFNKLDNSF